MGKLLRFDACHHVYSKIEPSSIAMTRLHVQDQSVDLEIEPFADFIREVQM